MLRGARVVPEIVERVVHPPHVPLEVKPSPPGAGRETPGHASILRDLATPGAPLHHVVQLPEELDRSEVLPAAQLFGTHWPALRE